VAALLPDRMLALVMMANDPLAVTQRPARISAVVGELEDPHCVGEEVVVAGIAAGEPLPRAVGAAPGIVCQAFARRLMRGTVQNLLGPRASSVPQPRAV
jgi:hypothetical protein